MFPIIQPGGEVVAFSGRIVPPHDEDADRGPPPKYVNSSESLLFTKGKSLFGLAAARQAIRASKRAILVEGNVDVVKLHQWGHEETIAPLGTALTPEQARLLGRFAEQAIMCFDGDKAGKKAAWSALPLLLEADLDVRMVLLPEGEDPDSVGPERFSALLAAAKPALEEMMIRIAAKAGSAAHARARALDRVAPLIARVARPSARGLYADRAAELFDIPPARVEAAIEFAKNAGSGPSGGRRSDDRGGGRRGRRDAYPGPNPQENSRAIPSTSRAPVPVSPAEPAPAADPGRGPNEAALPTGQAELTMLLVDLPHLASVAERTGAIDWVKDARLRPIVDAVVEGAKRGENPTMDGLLDQVDPSAQRQVYGAVFAGRYRQDGDAASPSDPQALLSTLVARCRIEELDHRIDQLDQDIRQAQGAGFPDKARELLQLKLDLRRQQAVLREGGSVPASDPEAAAPTVNPGASPENEAPPQGIN
jgi:DNA primase